MLIHFSRQLNLLRDLLVGCNIPSKSLVMMWPICYLQKHQIPSQFTEAFHPNENYCEHHGGAIKAAVVHILMTSNAALEFWCYCLELVFLLQSVLARCSLGSCKSQELHYGEMPDISMF